MAIAPGTNCITQYEDRLRETIADCDSFTSFVDDLVTPESRIHIYDLQPPIDGDVYSESEWEALHPYCLIAPPEDGENFAMERIASPNTYAAGFSYEIKFEKKPAGVPYSEEIRLLTNPVGDIAEELQDRSRTHGLGIDRFSPADRPEVFPCFGDEFGPVVYWTWLIQFRFSQ